MSTPTAYDNLLFDIRRSVRYHDRRLSHYATLHRTTNAVTILLAGVVLTEFLSSQPPALWAQVLAVLAALFSVGDLVIGFSSHADTHRDLKRQFTDLERRLLAHEPLAGIEQDRVVVEADEPPIYRALDVLCHNALCVAIGRRDDLKTMPWFMALTANWIHWPRAGEMASNP
jgi:hypothetical protein